MLLRAPAWIALSLGIALMPLSTAWAQAPAAGKAEFKSAKDKASYAIGLQIGKGLKMQQAEVNPDLIARGLRDALGSEAALLTDQEIEQALEQFQEETIAHVAEKAKREGEAFLAANAKKPGVTTTASGLQYKILAKGNGPVPTANDMVTTNYRGTLVDGHEFDNSYKRGQPASFRVGGVIPGWAEALQMMPAGSKWQLFVPAKLAYGDRGVPGAIPPNSTLVFEVELLGIGAPKTEEGVLPKVRVK